MSQTCAACSSTFVFTEEDQNLLAMLSPVIAGTTHQLPTPKLCPSCRKQRRLLWRNERNLYHRECDATGKKLLSNVSPEHPFPIYEREYWFSDNWNTLDYGRDFDFSKTFAENFVELQKVVPRASIQQPEVMENSEYCNFASHCKDCYLIFDSDFCRDCYYCNVIKKSESCLDCSFQTDSELCYECINSKKCYNLRFSQNCVNCNDSLFLESCIGCKQCAFSVNLQNKQYVFGNKQMTKEQYEKAIASMGIDKASNLEKYRKEFREYCSTQIHKYQQGTQNENCTGNHIANSKDVRNCYDMEECWDVAHSELLYRAKNCMDVSSFGENIELIYQTTTSGLESQRCAFCFIAVKSSHDLLYCDSSNASANCFGCCGIRRQEYCILNKQYSKEEYEALVAKIIDHMRETGEWGEFFPPHLSPFGYNETIAMDYFPLNKEEATAKGFRWLDSVEQKDQYMGPTHSIPDASSDIPDDICDKILTCSSSGKQYKIIPRELEFYRKMGLPLPRKCPDVRHAERMALRNPSTLYNRTCDNCRAQIETTYSPERPEKIFCEPCYQNSLV